MRLRSTGRSSPASASPPGSSSTFSSDELPAAERELAGRLAALRRSSRRRSSTRSAAGSTVKTNHLRSAAFYCGLATLALAVASPVDAYSDRLFWAHMTQHVLLTMVAPPLLLLGRPWPRMLKPFAPSVRRPVARAVLVGPTLGPLRRIGRWLARPLPCVRRVLDRAARLASARALRSDAAQRARARPRAHALLLDGAAHVGASRPGRDCRGRSSPTGSALPTARPLCS